MSHSGMRELGAKHAAVPRLDVLSLRLHRLWIVFHQLDGGERSAVCLLLHEAMEGAHAVKRRASTPWPPGTRLSFLL